MQQSWHYLHSLAAADTQQPENDCWYCVPWCIKLAAHTVSCQTTGKPYDLCKELLLHSMAYRRDRVRSKLQQLLSDDASLAHNLELAIYNHCIQKAKQEDIPRYWECPSFCSCYSFKARSVLYNLGLPQNPGLKQRVLNGAISVLQLVEMSHQDLYPERWVEVMYDVARMAHHRMAPEPGAGLSGEGAFTCGRCKSKRTTYFQLQTRSADEPMTTFVTCIDCNKRWKM